LPHTHFFLNDRRGGKWRSPQAAVIPDLHLPMRSFEVKNRQDNNNNNKLLSIFQQVMIVDYLLLLLFLLLFLQMQ
jgi:hypothetical protein